MEVVNQVIQKYVKSVRRFDSLRVFIKHVHEQYDAMITFIQITFILLVCVLDKYYAYAHVLTDLYMRSHKMKGTLSLAGYLCVCLN